MYKVFNIYNHENVTFIHLSKQTNKQTNKKENLVIPQQRYKAIYWVAPPFIDIYNLLGDIHFFFAKKNSNT